MYFYQDASPYRHHFNWIIMPTTDSTPPKTDWLYTYQNAELVVPYTAWAKKILTQYCGSKINLFPKIANAGINPTEFYPIDNKIAHKEKYFGQNLNIVGLVMRNQKRKLIPDIFIAFKTVLEALKQNNQTDTYNKTYLYLHTSYPEDSGWDIPSLLLEYELLDKVSLIKEAQLTEESLDKEFKESINNLNRKKEMCKKLVKNKPSLFSTLKNIYE